jgi:hypothetical protein
MDSSLILWDLPNKWHAKQNEIWNSHLVILCCGYSCFTSFLILLQSAMNCSHYNHSLLDAVASEPVKGLCNRSTVMSVAVLFIKLKALLLYAELTNSTKLSCPWEANLKVHYHVRKSMSLDPIMSQVRPFQNPHSISLRLILILYSHLCINLPSGLFPSGFPPKIIILGGFVWNLCETVSLTLKEERGLRVFRPGCSGEYLDKRGMK